MILTLDRMASLKRWSHYISIRNWGVQDFLSRNLRDTLFLSRNLRDVFFQVAQFARRSFFLSRNLRDTLFVVAQFCATVVDYKAPPSHPPQHKK
jgi:hypothetical protein